jgi:hypothetical protein
MDALQRSVLATVEAAARDDEDPQQTFHKVKALAWQAAGRPARELPMPAPSRPPKVRAPRLAEAWFC